MPANAFKTLFLLLTLLATCTQCLLNEKKVSRYTPSSLGLRTSGISESAILIFGRVLKVPRNFVSAYLASLSSRESTGVSDSAHHQQISRTCFRPTRFGSNDSRLHVVEPPRGRSFIWQIGVNSSIQDRRQVDRGFLWSRVSCTRQR